jgi:hypothetical protein
MVILSPTFMAISSYSLMLILNVGESVGKPAPVMALDMFPIAFGKFFIKSSGDVNAIIFIPNGFCGFSAPTNNHKQAFLIIYEIYQLANLIIYELSKVLERWKTKIIFLSDLLHTFLQDPQVDVEESKYLIKQITESIQRLLNNTLVVT